MTPKNRKTKASGKPSGTHSADPERMQRDLQIALRRVGRTPEERAQWLVKFLAEDPRELSTEEHIAREQQAAMFVSSVISESDATLTKAELSLGTGATFGDQHLREVWLHLRGLMTRWAAGERVKIGSTTTHARRRADTGKDLHAQIVRVGEDREAFVVSAFDVLANPKVRIRRCDECQEFFVPRRRQERHPDCARKHHDQEWNAKRRKETEEKQESKEKKNP